MMIKKLIDSAPRMSHEDLADPHAKAPFEERLRRAGAVDHRDNLMIEDEGGGYVRFRPADPNRCHGSR